MAEVELGPRFCRVGRVKFANDLRSILEVAGRLPRVTFCIGVVTFPFDEIVEAIALKTRVKD